MCERLTSHLFEINNAPIVHDIGSHSHTRDAIGIGDSDGRYADVEWREDSPIIEIRFPDSWGEAQREYTVEWYARHAPTRDDLVSYCLLHGKVIHLRNGDNIPELPKLPECERLNCYGCTGLTALPKLPKCGRLNCYGCTGLTALPELPECDRLECVGCTGLTALPKLPECEGLDCGGCTGLTALPELSECEWLNCYGCTGLTALPELPECEWLNCGGCTGMSALPKLPKCEVLECYGPASGRVTGGRVDGIGV